MGQRYGAGKEVAGLPVCKCKSALYPEFCMTRATWASVVPLPEYTHSNCGRLRDWITDATTLLLDPRSAQQEGYRLNAIPAAGICGALREDGYEAAVVMHCLKSFGAPVGADAAGQQQGGAAAMDTDGGPAVGTWALDECKVG